MKKIRTPIDSVTRATERLIERCGTNVFVPPPGPIDINTSVAYTNVATNVPSVNCVPRSRMKLRSMRGPNCVEASVRVTIVIENTTPTTVITAAASVVRIWRAASAEPKITHEGSLSVWSNAARSIACVPKYRPTATITSIIGTSHKFVLRASRRHDQPSGNGNTG